LDLKSATPQQKAQASKLYADHLAADIEFSCVVGQEGASLIGEPQLSGLTETGANLGDIAAVASGGKAGGLAAKAAGKDALDLYGKLTPKASTPPPVAEDCETPAKHIGKWSRMVIYVKLWIEGDVKLTVVSGKRTTMDAMITIKCPCHCPAPESVSGATEFYESISGGPDVPYTPEFPVTQPTTRPGTQK
jgi:hypothetical protein